MEIIKLAVAPNVTEQVVIPFRLVTLGDDGFIGSPPMGDVYLDPGSVYDCTIIDERYIEFLDAIDEVFFDLHDLQKLIRQNLLTITKT